MMNEIIATRHIMLKNQTPKNEKGAPPKWATAINYPLNWDDLQNVGMLFMITYILY